VSRLVDWTRELIGQRTLRHRVSLRAVLVITGWLVVLAAVFDAVIVSRLDAQVDDALRVRAEAATATVVVSGGAVTGVRDSADDGELDSSIWVFAGSRVLAQPDRHRHDAADVARLVTAARGFHSDGDERFYVLPVEAGGARIGTVVAAIDREPYDHTRDIVVVGSVLVVVLGALGAYPVLALTTRRSLRPVADMTRQAAEWSVTAPEQRFGDERRYAELDSLAGTLDELLDRLAAVLRHERQLPAALSHELRTPLARVSGEVELLLGSATGEARERLLAVRDDCAAMDSIMDTLMAAARSELVGTVGRCELDAVLRSFAADDPRVRAEPTPLTAGVDAELVTRMLSPVVENAYRYARTSIRLRADRDGPAVTVAVSNDGPRVDGDLAEAVFEPGFTAGDHDGVGLGLALARRLARSADGDLVLDPAGPETTFRLTLPAG
jgi:signal transduction histidine kinase